jgi:hypothetical protein
VNKGGRERGKCHNRHQKSLKNLKKTEKEILVRVLSVQKAAHRRINGRADWLTLPIHSVLSQSIQTLSFSQQTSRKKPTG